MQAVRLGSAAALARSSNEQAQHLAAALVPEDAESLFRLAALDPERAAERLATALRRNPRFTSARLARAAYYETAGQLDQAERELLAAAHFDKLFTPAWALTNFYFRTHRLQEMWSWAAIAAPLAPPEPAALFQLLHAAPGSVSKVVKLLPDRPALLSAYTRFLIETNEIEPLAEAALRMLRNATPNEIGIALTACDRLMAAGRIEQAIAVWNAADQPRVVPAAGESLVNGGFSRLPVNQGFDWRVYNITGAEARIASGMHLLLSGSQTIPSEPANQYSALLPGRNYRLSVVSDGSVAGVRFRVFDAASRDLTTPIELDQPGTAVRVLRSPAQGLARLAVTSEARAAGELTIRSVRLELLP